MLPWKHSSQKALWLGAVFITSALNVGMLSIAGQQFSLSQAPDETRITQNRTLDLQSLNSVFRNTLKAHGGRVNLSTAADSVSEGTITLFTAKGAGKTLPITVMRKGADRVQRIIRQPGGESRQGTDGTRLWDGFAGMWIPEGSRAPRFVEGQTTRSPAGFFQREDRLSDFVDLGVRGTYRVLETRDGGTPTRYFVDLITFRIARLEYETGVARDMLSGRAVPQTEAYVFSDYRSVSGIATPFRIEHYSGAQKIEEIRFSSVRYNAGIKDGAFRPQGESR